MPQDKSTEDYRPYPKGPNFLTVVIAFAVAILLILGVAYLFLSDYGKHLLGRANTQSLLLTPSITIHRAAPELGRTLRARS